MNAFELKQMFRVLPIKNKYFGMPKKYQDNNDRGIAPDEKKAALTF